MKPHKHAELIKLWADGAVVEWKCSQGGTWHQLEDIMNLVKYDSVEYRIKPEPKPDVYCAEHFYLGEDGDWRSTNMSEANLKLTFDGETGELKSAEVLK